MAVALGSGSKLFHKFLLLLSISITHVTNFLLYEYVCSKAIFHSRNCHYTNILYFMCYISLCCIISNHKNKLILLWLYYYSFFKSQLKLTVISNSNIFLLKSFVSTLLDSFLYSCSNDKRINFNHTIQLTEGRNNACNCSFLQITTDCYITDYTRNIWNII